MAGKNDGSLRVVVALLAKKPDLTAEERTRLVMDLVEDGLTLADVAELYPSLLGPDLSTPARTASSQLATVQTTYQPDPAYSRSYSS